MVVVVLIAVVAFVACLMIAVPSIGEGMNSGSSDYTSNGLLFLILAIILFFLIANLEIYPTCTLDGLLD